MRVRHYEGSSRKVLRCRAELGNVPAVAAAAQGQVEWAKRCWCRNGAVGASFERQQAKMARQVTITLGRNGLRVLVRGVGAGQDKRSVA